LVNTEIQRYGDTVTMFAVGNAYRLIGDCP